MPKLPDAEKICEELARELQARIGPKTAMIGIYTGGAWLAERLHARLGLREPLGEPGAPGVDGDHRRARADVRRELAHELVAELLGLR